MSIYTNSTTPDIIGSIYVITCLINNKKYVGFTKRSIATRWKEHIKYSKINDTALYNAMRKYGVQNFNIESIYQSKDINHTFEVMEQYFIIEYNSRTDSGYGYNSVDGGIGITNPSTATRHKISKSLTGKPRLISNQARLSYTKHKGELISPSGTLVFVDNFEQFARDNNLSVQMLIRVNNGTMENHRGWRSKNFKGLPKKSFHPTRIYQFSSPDNTNYVVDNHNLSGFCKFYSLGCSSIHRLINGAIQHHHGWTLSDNTRSTKL